MKIISRRSALALWQANFVKERLQSSYPDLLISIISIETEGDKRLDASLAKMGGKGLFVKALEEQLLSGEADIAVHSVKDMPVELPEGLELVAILKREDPRDAFVSIHFKNLHAISPETIVGTSSLRRQSQLQAIRSNLNVVSVRGNVDTRLQKLDNGALGGLILAVAGLKRLGLASRITEYLSTDIMLPAVGQGALGIECRVDDEITKALIAPLNDTPSAQCVLAERSMNTHLGGSCEWPIGGLARINHAGSLTLQGMVAAPNGSVLLKANAAGRPEEKWELGHKVAEQLLAQGAQDILNRWIDQP